MPLQVRTYGSSGPVVFLLHGGPGAPGSMAPVARRLAEWLRAVEPWQRTSTAGQSLSVARHVADLDDLLRANSTGDRPALVGSSWGAMLALAYAAAHPRSVGPLVLIGCGTFDSDARDQFRATLAQRTDAQLEKHLEDLTQTMVDPDRRLQAMAELLMPLYAYNPLPGDSGVEQVDAQGHQETWNDMLQLQRQGVYPAAFAAIKSPVLMLHGEFDPHPGAMIHRGLRELMPQMEYHELERCGHYPWLEKHAAEEFYALLRAWLARHVEAAR